MQQSPQPSQDAIQDEQQHSDRSELKNSGLKNISEGRGKAKHKDHKTVEAKKKAAH
jgi:hypothetical protein